MTKEEMIQTLKQEIARETGLPVAEIDDTADFLSLGLDSVSCVFVLDKLEKKIQIELNPIFFWDYPTVASLSEHLVNLKANE
ncbi:MAG: acyl carrier protein [Bacteroidota bacterium]